MKQLEMNKLNKITDIALSIFIVLMLFIYEGKSSIIYIISLLGLFIIAVLNLVKHKKLLIDKKVILVLIFIFFSTLSLLWAENIENVLKVLVLLIGNELIAYIVMLLIYYKKDRLHLVMYSVIAGTIVLGARVFISNGLLAYSSVRTIDGFNANYLGMYAAIAANFALYYAINKKKNVRILFIISFILCVLITILSFSRKALIFLFLPMIIYYIFKEHSLKISAIKILIVVILGLVALFAIMNIEYLYETIGWRIEVVINGMFNTGGEIDDSVSARMSMIEIGKELFAKRPILGYGLNNYKNMLLIEKPYGMTNVYAHNNYIELMVDLGIIGLAIYYALYIYIIYYALKKFKKLNSLQLWMFAILITLMICEYGVVSYYGDFYKLLLSLIWITIIYNGEEVENGNRSSN